MSKRVTLCLTLALAAVAWASAAEAKEGFGRLSKKTAQLVRVEPPTVFLPGERIAVRAGLDDAHVDLVHRLVQQLESELLSRESRLTAVDTNPQVEIEVSILRNDLEDRWETREVMVQRPYQDSKGKTRYRLVQGTARFLILDHSFVASFQVVDLESGASLAADTVEIPFHRSFQEGEGAPARFTLEDRAIRTVVETICRRITPTREAIGVLLPKGRLADLVRLAQAGLWTRYLEALQELEPAADPGDESYRQYAIGTAYEALGYEAGDPEVTLRYLEQADLHYGKAVEANPQEKFFTRHYDALLTAKTAEAPLERVRNALVDYRRILDFAADATTARASAGSTGEPASAKSLEDGGEEPGHIDNAAVIRMVRAGLPEQVIVTAIDSASAVAFDTSPRGLIELAEAEVEPSLIQVIQKAAATPVEDSQ